MEWIQLIGFCLLAAVMVTLLRQMSPQIAALLSVAFGAMVVSLILPSIRSYVETIRAFLASLALEAEYYRVMLKAMGIVLVTQLATQVCHELEAPSIAQKAELCGRVALLGVALPVFVSLTQMAVDALR